MSHTKEKRWNCSHNSASDNEHACIEIHDENNLQIAYIQSSEHIDGITKKQAEENAAVMAAAPDLLEALKRCRFDSLNMSLDDMDFIRAAIARATGEGK